MTTTASQLLDLQEQLASVASEVQVKDSPESWNKVETIAHAIANGLRVKDGPVDVHTNLGNAGLPQTIGKLLERALPSSSIPDADHIPASIELLRVSANLCMDHDKNRGFLLDAGVPLLVINMLKGYLSSLPHPPITKPFSLPISQLKLVRTAVGVLLNMSIGYDPAKLLLTTSDAPAILLRLSTSLYPPGSWTTDSTIENTEEENNESWTLRSGIASWTWRAISELREVKEDSPSILSPDTLGLLIPPLLMHIPPYPTLPLPLSETSINLISADFECLEESCALIEALSLDYEDTRLSLARGFCFPAEHDGIPCLSSILDFIEKGNYSPAWNSPEIDDAERIRMRKEFNICKAALIKCVVEVAGEEKNEEVLWDDSEDEKPGGDFVCRMVRWVKDYANEMDNGNQSAKAREDLAICATLSLGNLARKEAHTATLLAEPHAIADIITTPHLLSASADIKVKHGVIGLLKHLSQSSVQSPEIHTTLAHAHVLTHITECGIWGESSDPMAEVVQLGAIGVAKFLCNNVVENIFELVLPPDDSTSLSGLKQILALVRRSDSVPVKCEGTRVLVNVVKSLWSNVSITSSPISSGPSPIANGTVDVELENQRKKTACMRLILTRECVTALANLIRNSAKYPLLVNEGVVALSLLSTQKSGANLVVAALIEDDMPPTEPPSTSTSLSTDMSSPTMTTPSTAHHNIPLAPPPTSLDMLINVLRNVDNPVNFQPEVRINVCSLLIQVGKNASGDGLSRVKALTQPVLEWVIEQLEGAQGKEETLVKSAKKVIEVWS